MPLSLFAMMDSVMMRPLCGALWQVPARRPGGSGRLRMADPASLHDEISSGCEPGGVSSWGWASVTLRTHHKPNFILVTLHASSQVLSPALAGLFISGWLNGLRVRNETARL